MKTIKQGYQGSEVLDLRKWLKDTGTSSLFDQELNNKVQEFQKSCGLVADGIVGPLTWKQLYISYRGKSSLSREDYIWGSQYLGVDPGSIYAVTKVETGGRSGFLSNGSPKILFEGHIFWKELIARKINPYLYCSKYPSIVYKTWTKRYYKGGIGEWDRFNTASSINSSAAIASSSWGIFQIMGNNYKKCGCSSLTEFREKMSYSEISQFILGLDFIKNSDLTRYLKARNWAGFARRYNGPSYAANKYDQKLAAAYKTWK